MFTSIQSELIANLLSVMPTYYNPTSRNQDLGHTRNPLPPLVCSDGWTPPGGVSCKFLRVRELDAFSCTVVSEAERFGAGGCSGIAWILSFGSAQDMLSLLLRMTDVPLKLDS
jgi:hypothetical protein